MSHLEPDSSDSRNVDYDEDNISIEERMPIEHDPVWRSQSKHIFILSEAGKPIYSLYVFIFY